MKQRDLKKLRAAKGETIRQVAIALAVTEKTYSSWESGERIPDGPNLVRLADHFGVHPRELVPVAVEAK